MILNIEDWSFEIDLEQTLADSNKIVSDHCQCGYCRNYYATISMSYPDFSDFLRKFGIAVDGPDELMPFEPTLYEATYCVCGRILYQGSAPIQVGPLQVRPLTRDQLDYDTECPMPCFALVTGNIELPWLLEEDMDEVISPANEPEYLERMWNRLLMNAEDKAILS